MPEHGSHRLPNVLPGLGFPGRLPSPGLHLDLQETSLK